MHRVAPRRRSAWVVAAGVTVLVAAGLLRAVVSRSAQTPAASHDMAGMTMSDDQMLRMYRAKAHPSRAGFPAGVNQTLVVADSFVATGTLRFNEDNNTATVVDTAHIQVGDAIRFKWGAGIHSVTSGSGSLDPNSGLLFNVDPFSSASSNFDFQFNQAGVYPFYCLYHEASNMKGVVIVGSVDAAPPIAVGAKVGFVAPPWPNPTRYDATFRVGLASAGHTRIDVLDLEGRRIASVLDRDMPAGTFVARWDGSRGDGRPAPAGIYLIRLRGPGVNESRRVTLER